MIEITPLSLLLITLGLFGLCAISLLLGLFLGYSASRVYNTTTRDAMDNLVQMNEYLSEKLASFSNQVQIQVPQIFPSNEVNQFGPRDDAHEAYIEENMRTPLDAMLEDLPLAQQAQIKAMQETPDGSTKQ